MATVKMLYFAWVRERIGRGEETLDVPSEIATVEDLLGWLSQRGPEYAAAFAKLGAIRAAVDQEHVSQDTTISGAREIALFPPVTGG